MGTFIALIDHLADAVAPMQLDELAEYVIDGSGLVEFHGQERGERGQARKENLQELVSACRQFSGDLVFPLEDGDRAEVSVLQEFLDQMSLDAGDRQSAQGPSVQMMTLHSAKGLEFPLVFLGGMEGTISLTVCQWRSLVVLRKSGGSPMSALLRPCRSYI